jgi:amidase
MPAMWRNARAIFPWPYLEKPGERHLDEEDFTAPPVPLIAAKDGPLRIAFFTDNRVAACSTTIVQAVEKCAKFLSEAGHEIVENWPPAIEEAYELELSLLGADGADGIDGYLKSVGSTQTHPLLEAGFLGRMRAFRSSAAQLATNWEQWDKYRTLMIRFFNDYDAVLCPVYTQAAFKHGESVKPGNFEGFSYTMAWNVSGNPAATVRVAEAEGLPVNVQIVTARWHDLLALRICRSLEERFGGWQPPVVAQALRPARSS